MISNEIVETPSDLIEETPVDDATHESIIFSKRIFIFMQSILGGL